MIQSTIYHIRQYGQNIFDPEEKDKYYSEDFLQNQRHVNDKVEQELEEFKVEINEKVEANSTKNYKFIRKDPAHMIMGTVDQINLSHADHSGYPDADYGPVHDDDEDDRKY